MKIDLLSSLPLASQAEDLRQRRCDNQANGAWASKREKPEGNFDAD